MKKYIILLLTICSIIALFIAISAPIEKTTLTNLAFDFHNKTDILFLIEDFGGTKKVLKENGFENIERLSVRLQKIQTRPMKWARRQSISVLLDLMSLLFPRAKRSYGLVN